jgi:hypothetical protein
MWKGSVDLRKVRTKSSTSPDELKKLSEDDESYVMCAAVQGDNNQLIFMQLGVMKE